MSAPFWQSKSLEDMNEQEWEAICDGCGKCCLHKFIEDDGEEPASGETLNPAEQVHYTNIACTLLNTKTCSCSHYKDRNRLVADCVKLTKDNLKDLYFMPTSCSYRRLHEGRGLPSWHPLLNRGKKAAMHRAGMSVRGKTVFETEVDLEQFEDYIAIWPLEDLD